MHYSTIRNSQVKVLYLYFAFFLKKKKWKKKPTQSPSELKNLNVPRGESNHKKNETFL